MIRLEPEAFTDAQSECVDGGQSCSLQRPVDTLTAPRSADGRCINQTTAEIGPNWTTIEIDVPASCSDVDMIHGLTISHPSVDMDLYLDEIRFD